MKPTISWHRGSSLVIATLLAACGGGGGYDGNNVSVNGNVNVTGSGVTVTPGNGVLYVSLTDAPSCGFDAVNITVNKIRVNQSSSANENDAGWTDIVLNPAQKINLLNLNNGTLLPLGQTPLTPGHYSQIRLVLDPNPGNGIANSIVASGTTAEVPLDTPSAVVNGIKLVNEFDVAAGQRADVVIDFDACKSIVTKGNGKYGLKPVVKVVPSVLNGIDGYMNLALLGYHVFVSAQQNGEVVSATVPNVSTGEFFLGRLPPGNYDVVITADNQTPAVIANVPVMNSTSVTLLSNPATPLNLPSAVSYPADISGTAGLSPISVTEVPLVSARQSFTGGPGFTMKYVNADALTAAYNLHNLPTVAPLLAQYTAVLPLVFTSDKAVLPGAGKYTVQASANGYKTAAVSNVDISTGNKTDINFVLVP
ncbi:DUF4382 domain-containing protein [Undibacterium sp. TS12]|uniref:DUF4382 domain-containing protein n=1 Tax=Undibacterium sp. TS12 TaxID=2908202 RepID=UPI001F4C72BD|nr:DUF4382 domain-containing protein [Undibacterium sp. TS12]MCH8622385.1 DUF4382 domain-containing protein [Undibacterium sp. TS12]